MGSDVYTMQPIGTILSIHDSRRIPVKKPDRRPGPFPYYGASGITDWVDSYIFDGIYLLLAEDGENLKTKSLPVAFIAEGKFWVNNHAHILQGDDALDTRFFGYALKIADIDSYLSGSTRPKLTQGDMKRIPVYAPSPDKRRTIAEVLGTLDDKIELNRQMNRTLEAIARAIFKAWFVDFEPVKAKAAGATSFRGMPQAVFDQLPDRFTDTELVPVPAGWEVGELGQVMEHPRRTIRPAELDEATPYIGLEHMPQKSVAITHWGQVGSVTSNKHRFNRGELLFGKLRPYFHKVGIAPVDGVCSTDVVVITPKGSEWFGYVLGHISSSEFVSYTTAASTGTKMPRTNWGDMTKYRVVLPKSDFAHAYSQVIASLADRIVAGIHEACSLAAMRDALLPKLISGELRVPVAEEGAGGG